MSTTSVSGLNFHMGGSYIIASSHESSPPCMKPNQTIETSLWERKEDLRTRLYYWLKQLLVVYCAPCITEFCWWSQAMSIWCLSQWCKSYSYLQCQNYSKGLITGSLCSSFCDTHELQFEKCLGHGIKLHVLRAKMKGNKVVLKIPKKLGSHSVRLLETVSSKPLTKDFKMTRQEFMTLVSVCPHMLF